MKVILTEDRSTLGKVGDIVDVKNGYARNYLLPRKLAIPATTGAEKRIEHLKKRADALAAKKIGDLKAAAEKLSGLSVTISAKTNGDILYGSIGVAEIAKAVLEEHKIEVPESTIKLEEPIKAVGTTDVDIKSAADAIATIKVWVVSEDADDAQAEDDEEEATEESSEAEAESADEDSQE